MNSFYKAIREDRLIKGSVALFLIVSLWWLVLQLTNASDTAVLIWADTYHITAIFGAIAGFAIARRWGGLKSMMGRAIIMFSIGLFCEWFAQVAGVYLVWKVGTVPYPSISDIGAFGAIIFYSVAVIYLAKASGARPSLKSYRGKLIAALVPILFLSSSFAIFLRSYQFDWSAPLITFLDIGYPLGEAFYVSLAILAYLLSRKVLGGIMREPILFFIAALVTEYIADFLFLYQSHAGTYIVGGFNDLLFVVSYSLMAISLIQLGVVYKWIKES
jgi:hypothetical protein